MIKIECYCGGYGVVVVNDKPITIMTCRDCNGDGYFEGEEYKEDWSPDTDTFKMIENAVCYDTNAQRILDKLKDKTNGN